MRTSYMNTQSSETQVNRGVPEPYAIRRKNVRSLARLNDYKQDNGDLPKTHQVTSLLSLETSWLSDFATRASCSSKVTPLPHSWNVRVRDSRTCAALAGKM